MQLGRLNYSAVTDVTPLFADFIHHFNRVADYYTHRPDDPASYAKAAAAVEFPPDRREALVSALRAQNGDSAALDLLARPGTCVVATGQQVGLFLGPAYTVYKALTAAKLARQLTERGVPAVAVFWQATEDHDIPEIDHCWVFDQMFQPQRLQVECQYKAQQTAGGIRIPRIPTVELRNALRDFPFAEEVAALVEETYPDGCTFGSGFSALLRKLCSSYDLLSLDPLVPAVRDLAAPFLSQAVRAVPELVPLVLERGKALLASGYHAQVQVEPHSSLFFLLEEGRRLALRFEDGAFMAGDRKFSAAELADRASQLSPNALLRPVMQDCILPTVAYIGGPAEVAYFAQSQVLYNTLLGRMPVVLPRNSFTLLDGGSAKRLQRYELTLPELRYGEAVIREQISGRLVPPALAGELTRTRSEASALLEELSAGLADFDVTLASASEKSKAKILYQLSKMERKVAREALRRDERANRDAASLSGLLFPNRHPQERLYSILPFLARHGLELTGNIYENIQPDCFDHQVLQV